ncbi:hypothetical protein ACF0H5_009768 [Mactra antiquata]
MKIAVLVAAVVAVVCVTYATKCDHNDSSMCNMTCSDASLTIGCEHGLCTCVTAPMSCDDWPDCVTLTCAKHDESPHCIDKTCRCEHIH